jgi:hypothetical protein
MERIRVLKDLLFPMESIADGEWISTEERDNILIAGYPAGMVLELRPPDADMPYAGFTASEATWEGFVRLSEAEAAELLKRGLVEDISGLVPFEQAVLEQTSNIKGTTTMKNLRFPPKTAADKKPANLPSSAEERGDYLTKEMDEGTGLGKHEDKVNVTRAGESETQRKKEHGDAMRQYGPHIRLETAASAKTVLASLRVKLAEAEKELSETKDKAEGLSEKLPEEKKEADTLQGVIKELTQAEKDLKAAEKDLNKIEPGVAGEAEKEPKKAEKPEEGEKPEKGEKGINPFASTRFAYHIRRAAEEVAEKVEDVVVDVKEVIVDAKDAIKDAEKIIKHEEKEEGREGPHEEKPIKEDMEMPAGGKEGFVPMSFANRVLDTLKSFAGHKTEAVSAYPPGKTQEDKGDYETKEKMSQGQFEVKEWKGMASKDESLRAKEHKLQYTDIGKRAPLQGISLSAKFNPNRLPAKSAWVLYRNGVPAIQATFANVAGDDMTRENYAKFAGQQPFDTIDGKPISFGQAMIITARAKGLREVLAQTQGTLVKTAAEVGNADVAGENMDKGYLKKYYTEAYGDASFAAGLVASMSPKVATSIKDTIVALEAKIASVEADKAETVKAHKCVAVARLMASRGDIAFDRPSLEKQASALMQKSVNEIDKIATTLKSKPIKNEAALVTAAVPDKGDNSGNVGANEMADAETGVEADALDAVQDGPTKIQLIDGKLPAGSDEGCIEEGMSVNPDSRYDNQRRPLESVSAATVEKIRAKAAQKPSSQVVPQFTKTASETQAMPDGMNAIASYFHSKTEVGRLEKMGIDPGKVNKNFRK